MRNPEIHVRSEKWIWVVEKSFVNSNLINIASGITPSYLHVQFNF